MQSAFIKLGRVLGWPRKTYGCIKMETHSAKENGDGRNLRRKSAEHEIGRRRREGAALLKWIHSTRKTRSFFRISGLFIVLTLKIEYRRFLDEYWMHLLCCLPVTIFPSVVIAFCNRAFPISSPSGRKPLIVLPISTAGVLFYFFLFRVGNQST